jgi:putative flippase GtrA
MSAFRLAKFALSGGFATVVHSVGMYAFSLASFGPQTAFSLSFTFAVTSRFFVDRRLVFQVKAGGLAQFGRYVVACSVTYIMSASLFSLFLDVLGLRSALAFGISVLLTTVIGYVTTGVALTGGRRKTIA